MATSGGRRSLFWRVNTATAYTMLAGAGAFAIAQAASRAIGDDTATQAFLGMAVWATVFVGVGFVVSMVTYGALLRGYSVTPAADRAGPERAEPGAAADGGA